MLRITFHMCNAIEKHNSCHASTVLTRPNETDCLYWKTASLNRSYSFYYLNQNIGNINLDYYDLLPNLMS